MMSISRIIARDRRSAAVHEAGHAVIAMHVGVVVCGASIRRSRARDLVSQRAYIGQTAFGSSSDDDQYRMISVAGMVAEHVWREHGVIMECWSDAMCEPESMSPTDWAGTGCVPGDPDDALVDAAEAVETLLRGELFPQLTALSRKLIEAESRGTDVAVLAVMTALGHHVAGASDNATLLAAA